MGHYPERTAHEPGQTTHFPGREDDFKERSGHFAGPSRLSRRASTPCGPPVWPAGGRGFTDS